MCIRCIDGYTTRFIFSFDEYNSIIECDKNKNERPPLSAGSVAGIIIGVFVALLIVSGLIFFFVKKNKNDKKRILAAQPKKVEMEEVTAWFLFYIYLMSKEYHFCHVLYINAISTVSLLLKIWTLKRARNKQHVASTLLKEKRYSS